VLTASKRRCCLCYYLNHNHTERKGQIAHLNKDTSNPAFENLVWLCFEHHDQYDSRTSQSKGYIPEEVRTYRDRLYRELGVPLAKPSEPAKTPSKVESIEVLPDELKTVVKNAGGALDYLFDPWRFRPWPEVQRFLFPYKAKNRCDGICLVERLFLRDGRVATICHQIMDSPGLSVTNAIEELAFQICVRFKIRPADLVVIDYYPHRNSHKESNYSLVSFQRYPPNSMFDGPSWQNMSDEDWRDLGLRPRGKRRSLPDARA